MKKIILAAAAACFMVSCMTAPRVIEVKAPETADEQKIIEKDAAKSYDEGNYTSAVANLKALLKKEPKNPEYWGQLGSSYAQMNRFEYAAFSMRKAIQYNPKDVKSMYNLSIVYSEMGSPLESYRILNRALKLDPKNPMLQASLGNALIDASKLDEAKQIYNRLVEAKPDFDVGHFNLGVINYQKRDMDEAEKNYLNALSLNPDDYEIKGNLSAIYIVKEDYEKAIAYIKDVIASNPQNDITLENAYYNLGICYLRLEKFEDALKAFETALKIEPWDMAAYVNAAILAEKLGKKDKAINYWRRYDRLLPVNKRKAEMKQRLERLGVKSTEEPAAAESNGKK